MQERMKKTTLQRDARSDLSARGEPFVWGLGGALCLGVAMIIGFLVLIVWNGAVAFWPKPIEVVRLKDGSKIAGEPSRSETYRKMPKAPELSRTLYHIGNFDLYNEDFKWIDETKIVEKSLPEDLYFVERAEWGPFVGKISRLELEEETIEASWLNRQTLTKELEKAADRRAAIHELEKNEIGRVNQLMEEARLSQKKAALKYGKESEEYARSRYEAATAMDELQARYKALESKAAEIKKQDEAYVIALSDINGRSKVLKLSEIIRMYAPNRLNILGKLGVYLSRWGEFLTDKPREANTEGGVMPAIFGTFTMTILMALFVAPFGVVTALYLREYAKQGKLVSIVRISLNNLAGVPSIVYGVFGLGFFAYMVGGRIDQLFFPERLPSPTFGTGGILWASLTLALLTVPVVIVATEEALASVPKSMREGALACGASKWQTIKHIVIPKAMPGIMTGMILAMARGAGEVAPLMLVGVVKLAPELPIDGSFPFIHLERSFMHLGFHIFDVGFQSRNSEAGKPMVFVTTLLLIAIIAVMNAIAIVVRNRLKKKFSAGHF